MKYDSLEDLIRAHDAAAEHEARQRAAAAERLAAVEEYHAGGGYDPVQYYLDHCGDEKIRRLICGASGWDAIDHRRLIRVLTGGEGPVPDDAGGLLYAEDRAPVWLYREQSKEPIIARWMPENDIIEEWGDPKTIEHRTGSHVRSFTVYRLLSERKGP